MRKVQFIEVQSHGEDSRIARLVQLLQEILGDDVPVVYRQSANGEPNRVILDMGEDGE